MEVIRSLLIFCGSSCIVNIMFFMFTVHTLKENAEALVAASREIGLEVLIKLST